MQERKADISRVTGETNVHIAIDLDGTGKADIHTGIGFLIICSTALQDMVCLI